VDALWVLVWAGLVTNDTLHALRAYTRPPDRDRRPPAGAHAFRARRAAPPAAEGRWSLVATRIGRPPSATEWSAATAQQLLTRYGIVSREAAAAEAIEGGFSSVYEVLKRLEDSGRIRRGYFASDVAATQFALPAALDLLRSLREPSHPPEVVQVAATDPANPYGAILKWPAVAPAAPDQDLRFSRSVGNSVILIDGALAAYIGRRGRQVIVNLPAEEPDRTTTARLTAQRLAEIARLGEGRSGGLLIAEINGAPADAHPIAPFLEEAGFVASAMGYHVRRHRRMA
jgi:ATP-dependent Lhr-like helicase